MAEIILAFQDRFAPLVMDGRKQQTIRQSKPGKAAPAPGDVVWALGSNASQSLGKWPVVEVLQVEIALPSGSMRLGGRYELDDAGREAMAHEDGFTCWADMLQWFREQYAGLAVYDGYLIGWRFEERCAA